MIAREVKNVLKNKLATKRSFSEKIQKIFLIHYLIISFFIIFIQFLKVINKKHLIDIH